CFTALAGLGPLHGERMAARGGGGPLARGVVDPLLFVETSSYGGRARHPRLPGLRRGIVVFGFGPADAEPPPHPGRRRGRRPARHAIRVTNPARLLRGDQLADGEPLPLAGRDLTTIQPQERSDRDDHLVAARTVSRPA